MQMWYPAKGNVVLPRNARLFCFLEFLGYKRINLKTDQEESILTLKDSVKRDWSGEIVEEESPVKESQSNGHAENTNQQVQGLIRTHRDALESRYEINLTGKSVILPWIVKHAAASLTRFIIGKDGRSALQRLKGQRCRQDQGYIGECVMYLKPGTQGKSKADVRWSGGV